MNRVSIIQGLGGHDECVTPLVYTFNQIGIACDIYINHKLLITRGNIFEALDIKNEEHVITNEFEITSLPEPTQSNRVFRLSCGKRKLKKLIRYNHTHVLPILFWTTFLHAGDTFTFCLGLGFKIYAFIHNSLLTQRYERLFEHPNTIAVSFCKGMRDILHQDKDKLIDFYLPPMSTLARGEKPNATQNKTIRIAVPGKVDYHHRDYDLLINFAQESESRYPSRLQFIIAGGMAGEDGDRLMKSIATNNLEKTIILPINPGDTSSRFLSYRELFELINSCDIALENSTSVKQDNSKISGAVNLCVNFELPMLYLKGFSMYEEFDGLASINTTNLEQLTNTESNQFLSQKRNEATLVKLLMEESNRNSLQGEIEKLNINHPRQTLNKA